MGDFVNYVGRNWVIGGSEPLSYANAMSERERLWLRQASDSELRWKLYFIWREAAGWQKTRPPIDKFFATTEMPELVALLRTKGIAHLKMAAKEAANPKEGRLSLAQWLKVSKRPASAG